MCSKVKPKHKIGCSYHGTRINKAMQTQTIDNNRFYPVLHSLFLPRFILLLIFFHKYDTMPMFLLSNVFIRAHASITIQNSN